LQRPDQHSSGFVKSPGKKVANSDPHHDPRRGIARIEAQRGLEVVNREIRLPSPQPEPATPVPSASEARVELERTVDQCDGGIDVLAEITQHVGSAAEHVCIVFWNGSTAIDGLSDNGRAG